ncbi:MAG: hypothetical protein U9N44_06050 [Chloroflexota bacterium]|nr:hypothetical protein [Chloroflexota bacterium]
MSEVMCRICGFKTFTALAQKREGKFMCPQCGSFYEDKKATGERHTISTAKFKFKTSPEAEPA